MALTDLTGARNVRALVAKRHVNIFAPAAERKGGAFYWVPLDARSFHRGVAEENMHFALPDNSRGGGG